MNGFLVYFIQINALCSYVASSVLHFIDHSRHIAPYNCILRIKINQDTVEIQYNAQNIKVPCLLRTCDDSLLIFPFKIGADCCLWQVDGVFWPPVDIPEGPIGPLVVLISFSKVPLEWLLFWVNPIPAGADIVLLYGYLKFAERDRTPDGIWPSLIIPERIFAAFPCCDDVEGCGPPLNTIKITTAHWLRLQTSHSITTCKISK